MLWRVYRGNIIYNYLYIYVYFTSHLQWFSLELGYYTSAHKLYDIQPVGIPFDGNQNCVFDLKSHIMFILCHVPFLIFIVIRFIIILYCTNGPIKALFKIFGFHWTPRLWARTNHLIIEQVRGSAVARGSHRDEWRSFSKYGALQRAPTHTYFGGFIDLTGKTNGRRLQLSVET